MLLITVILIYKQFIIDDFNVNTFDERLSVLREYLRLVDDRSSIPPTLGYISAIDGHKYTVTYFETNNLTIVKQTEHDDRESVFHFGFQDFTKGIEVKLNKSSLSFHPTSARKFIAHSDDGDVEMSCRNGLFDGLQCAPKSLCSSPNTILPANEDNLNALIFNNVAARRALLTENTKTHPTLYIKCDEDLVAHLIECANGEVFLEDRCVYDPTIVTNGQGVVTALKKKDSTTLSIDQCSAQNGLDIEPKNKSKKLFFSNVKPIIKYKKQRITNFQLSFKKLQPTILKNGFDNRFESMHKEIVQKDLIFNVEPIHFVKKFATVIVKKYDIEEPTNLVYPINANTLHDAARCKFEGQTYIDALTTEYQYIECLGGDKLFLHTCTARHQKEDASFYCSMEDVCTQLENGSGRLVTSKSTDHIVFDTGYTDCVNYKISTIVTCDTNNFVNVPGATLDLTLPRTVFDGNSCVDYSSEHVKIYNDNFKVQIANDMGVDFSTALVGRVSKIINASSINNLHNVVTYSRDLGEIGVNPNNSMGLECSEDSPFLVDIFNNTRYNVCDDTKNLIATKFMEEHEYYDFKLQQIISDRPFYKGQCRLDDGENYLEFQLRQVNDTMCFYTIPL
ncbi:vp91 [Hyphantria cunea granulovirus]|uniref:Vp91 n=1 Tax=Hyphantria cunea granulovirus TaxID=307448 RepID=A0AAF1D297_9BBAC|nr:vp91 [Hyphantria cunea granulovirus]QBQ01642.1 vp91 [Hyphantria cunea granulovirus]